MLEEQNAQIEGLKHENADLSDEIKKRDETLADEKKARQTAETELTTIKNKWWYKLFAGKKGK